MNLFVLTKQLWVWLQKAPGFEELGSNLEPIGCPNLNQTWDPAQSGREKTIRFKINFDKKCHIAATCSRSRLLKLIVLQIVKIFNLFLENAVFITAYSRTISWWYPESCSCVTAWFLFTGAILSQYPATFGVFSGIWKQPVSLRRTYILYIYIYICSVPNWTSQYCRSVYKHNSCIIKWQWLFINTATCFGWI
jgi:hypothetical protein